MPSTDRHHKEHPGQEMMEESRWASHHVGIQQAWLHELADSPTYFRSSPDAQDYLSSSKCNTGSDHKAFILHKIKVHLHSAKKYNHFDLYHRLHVQVNVAKI